MSAAGTTDSPSREDREDRVFREPWEAEAFAALPPAFSRRCQLCLRVRRVGGRPADDVERFVEAAEPVAARALARRLRQVENSATRLRVLLEYWEQ